MSKYVYLKFALALTMLGRFECKSYDIIFTEENSEGLASTPFTGDMMLTSSKDASAQQRLNKNEKQNSYMPIARAKISYSLEMDLEKPANEMLSSVSSSLPKSFIFSKPACPANPIYQMPAAKCTCGLHRSTVPIPMQLYSFVLKKIPKQDDEITSSQPVDGENERSKRDLKALRNSRFTQKPQKKVFGKRKAKLVKRNVQTECDDRQESRSKLMQTSLPQIFQYSPKRLRPSLRRVQCPNDECVTNRDVIIKNFSKNLNASDQSESYNVRPATESFPIAHAIDENGKRSISTRNADAPKFMAIPPFQVILGEPQRPMTGNVINKRQDAFWQMLQSGIRDFNSNRSNKQNPFDSSSADPQDTDYRVKAALDEFIRYTISQYPKFFADSDHGPDSLVSPTQREDTVRLLTELILNRMKSWFNERLATSSGSDAFEYPNFQYE